MPPASTTSARLKIDRLTLELSGLTREDGSALAQQIAKHLAAASINGDTGWGEGGQIGPMSLTLTLQSGSTDVLAQQTVSHLVEQIVNELRRTSG